MTPEVTTEYMIEDSGSGISIARLFARAVKSFPVYVWNEWNGSFHASDSYIVASSKADVKEDFILVNNRRELLVAVQSLMDQRVKAAHELFKLSREY